MATDTEREYTGFFEKFIIQAYTKRFQDLSGKKFHVLQSRDVSATRALVLTEIVIPTSLPSKSTGVSAGTTNTKLPMLWSKASA